MEKTVDILQKDLCTGCGACFNACPADAIAMQPNEEGFLEPVIDGGKCINCGKCERTCPVLHPDYSNNKSPDCFAAWAADEIRRDSSSGGVFSVLADYVFESGGYVCGAVMNEHFEVRHEIIDDRNKLGAMRRSKYVISDTNDCYSRIKSLLKNNKTVLFCGCPCQVAGLKNYLGADYPHLILVDLVCHGAPPQKVFRKYLDDTYGIENVADFKFRTKEYGYNSYTQTVTLKSGTTLGRDFDFDYYEKVMHTGLALKNCCADCCFATAPRQGDFTIGDFWGITKHNPKLNDGLGTSLILINNKKAKKIFKNIEKLLKMCKPVPFEVARANNRFGRKINIPAGRKWFYTMLKSQPFEKAAKYALRRKFNIGVVGLWYGRNYGSMVTYYALHYTLTKTLGQSVLMIENCLRPDGKIEDTKTSPRTIAEKYYDISAKYSVTGLEALNSHCDTFLVGSDQLWNVYLSRPYKNTYFLGFADDNNKKISYGTSFGIPYAGTAQEKLIFSYFLHRFDHISVRDQLSEDICRKQFGITDVVQVCDPTFLCPKEEYIQLANKSCLNKKEDFILAYILDTDKSAGETIKKAAAEFGCKVYVILDELPDKRDKNAAALHIGYNSEIKLLEEVDLHEWLWYYFNAKAIITDSFHGTIFSIIFHKPFLTKTNNVRGAQRFESLLAPLGLTNRLHESYESLADSLQQLNFLDYAEADANLAKIKEFSFNWLKNAIEN